MQTIFRNLSVSKKLLFGFGFGVVSAIVLSVIAYWNILALKASTNALTDDIIPCVTKVGDMIAAANKARTYQIELTTGNTARVKELSKEIDDQFNDFNSSVKDYKGTDMLDEDKRLTSKVEASFAAWQEAWNSVKYRVGNTNQLNRTLLLNQKTASLFSDGVEPDLQALYKFNVQDSDVKKSDAEATISRATKSLLFVLIVTSAALTAIGVFISRSITIPLKAVSLRLQQLGHQDAVELQNGLNAFAQGDLTVGATCTTEPLPYNSKDEIGQMAATCNELLEHFGASMNAYEQARLSLSKLVARVRTEAAQISTMSEHLATSSEESTSAAQEIAQGSERLAQSASHAASAMQTVTASSDTVGTASTAQREQVMTATTDLQEATKRVVSVADAAVHMQTLSKVGSEAVERATEAIQRVLTQVTESNQKVMELSEQSIEIGAIVSTIQKIADQTNLLALNAAIEAARAGEQGRGFAVVADEVRKLAEQCGGSAQQIAHLIEVVRHSVDDTVEAIHETTREVELGSKQSQEAAVAIEQMLDSAKQVAHDTEEVATLSEQLSVLMGDVSTSATASQSAISEIVQSSRTVQEVVESVAAISEESSAGAQELNASITEVGNAATVLAGTSKELNELVAAFKLESGKNKEHQVALTLAA